MKDSEFLEILNLYLDHEISPEDSARLEAEVMASPDRRRVYMQYCRMHKACTLLGAPSTASTPAWAPEKAAGNGGFRRGWTVGIYAGGLLAAACLGVVVVLRMHPAASSPVVVPQETAPALAAAPVPTSYHQDFRPASAPRAKQ